MINTHRIIKVLVPSGRVRRVLEEPLLGVGNLGNKVIGCLDNGKPNFNLYVETIKERLANEYHVSSVAIRRKPSAGHPAPDQIINELTSESNLILVGSGD